MPEWIRRRGPVLLAFASLLIALPSYLSASQVRLLTLEQLSDHAARVFSGRCVDLRVAHDTALGQTITLVTLEVSRGAKGVARGRITLRMLGDQRATPEKGRGIEGVPRFSVGEDLVLFLYGESRHGLTSPVGFGQGKFTVVTGKDGQRRALNGFGNERLFEGLSDEARGRIGELPEGWKGKDGVPPEALLDLVGRLQK